MPTLGINTIEPVVDTQPLWNALVQVTSMNFLPKYVREFTVKKLRADIKAAQKALKEAERRLDEFSPPPPKKRRKRITSS